MPEATEPRAESRPLPHRRDGAANGSIGPGRQCGKRRAEGRPGIAIKASHTVKELSLLSETLHHYVQEGQIRKVSVSIMCKLLVPLDWRSHFGRRHLPRNPPASLTPNVQMMWNKPLYAVNAPPPPYTRGPTGRPQSGPLVPLSVFCVMGRRGRAPSVAALATSLGPPSFGMPFLQSPKIAVSCGSAALWQNSGSSNPGVLMLIGVVALALR